MDMATLLEQMRDQGIFDAVRLNTAAQFGPPSQRLVGAELFPERLVEENSFTETSIQYRTVVANDATRYSPPQRKGGKIIGEFDVKLAEQDIADEFSSRDYDALLRMLANNSTMDAIASLTRWFDTSIVRSLVVKVEVQRWQMMVDALVPLRGDNSYKEDVAYSNPANHRLPQVDAFSDDTKDPLVQLFERQAFLAAKGFQIGRIFAGTPVVQKILNNAKFKARAGSTIIVNNSGTISAEQGNATMSALNAILVADGLPPVEKYDAQYRTMTGTEFFLKRDVMVFVATTGRDELIDNGDEMEILPNTLGYAAIGRPAGQDGPGRALVAHSFDTKPPRIEGQGWQTSLPVNTEPEAIATIEDIT